MSVIALVVRYGKDIVASRATDMEKPASITLADVVHEPQQLGRSAFSLCQGLKLERKLWITVPKYAAMFTAKSSTPRPGGRIKVCQAIEWNDADRNRPLGTLFGCFRVPGRADQITMRRLDVCHHAEKRLDVVHVDLPRALFCIDDDASRVVRVVPGLNEHVYLPASSTDRPDDPCIWRNAELSRGLVSDHPSDHSFVDLPPLLLHAHLISVERCPDLRSQLGSGALCRSRLASRGHYTAY